MARARSNITKRISSLRGISTAEKRLLERVGSLVDAQINNRAPSNPHAQGRIRANKKLPPPKVITSDPGIKTAKLSWEAIDSSILSHYEIVITNMDDGAEETIKVWTNVYFYKGRTGGNYKATVCSVGKNGTKSPIIAEKFFTIPDNIMLLEGSKNSYNVEGNLVAEDIQFISTHKIFAWAAFTIDHLIGEAGSDNPIPSVQLWLASGDPTDQTFANAELIEEIPLFQATESATDLDDSTLGGISRPVHSFPAIRGTTYETSFSVMFSPITVDDYIDAGIVEENSTNTFFLRVIGREDENDIISLSLTLWSVPGGQSDQIPAITLSTEPPITDAWFTSVSLNADRAEGTSSSPTNPGGTHWYHSPALAGLGEGVGRKRIGRNWALAFWIKFERFCFATGNTGTYFFERFESVPQASFPTSTGFGFNFTNPDRPYWPMNGVSIHVGRQESPPFTGNVLFSIDFGGKETASLNGNSEFYQTYLWLDSYSNIDNDEFSNPVYTAVDPTEPVLHSGLNTWYLIFIKYNDIDGPSLYVNGIKKRTGSLFGTGTFPVYNKSNRGTFMHSIGGRGAFSIYRPDPPYLGSFSGISNSAAGNQKILNPCPAIMYAVGMWNSSNFTPGVIASMYSHPASNWREPFGQYNLNGNLAHYWQLSATLDDYDTWVARDTGWYIPLSGGFTGRANASISGYHPSTTNMPQSTIVVNDHP